MIGRAICKRCSPTKYPRVVRKSCKFVRVEKLCLAAELLASFRAR